MDAQNRPSDATTAREPDTTLAAVVDDVHQSIALTGVGIPSTFAAAVLGEPPESIRAYFSDGERAQVYVADPLTRSVVVGRLVDAGVPVSVISEIVDRERLS